MSSIKVSIYQLLFYVSFIIIVGSKYLRETVFVNAYPLLSELIKVLIIIACIFLLLKYILEPHTKKFIIFSIVILTIGVVVSYNSDSFFILMPVVALILNMSNIDITKVIKVWLIEIIALMIFLAICYRLNIVGEVINSAIRSDGKIRYALGYKYSTFSSNYFFHVTIFYLYLRKHMIKYVEIITLFLINLYLYALTDTRAVFYYSTAAIVICLLLKMFKIKTYSIILNKYSMLFSAIIAGVLSWSYRYRLPFFDQLDLILTGRLRLGSAAFNNFHITFFGQKIRWIYEQNMFSELIYNYVDSSYLNILFGFGIIILLLILVGYYIIGEKKLSRDTYYTMMIVFLSLHSTFDPQLIDIVYNPAILFLGYVIYNEDEIKNLNKIY
ncbi:polysaccharide polymerase [Streptococcus pneumoniae]|nr:hypothetical protein [Streptococcus pneumoniae]MBX4468579.1 hypothetical protein [Streptococcus pneumoniae]MBX4470709.1 hypothetical protein [Streptococcus pneumoniae]MBX4472670.1 hypothetical protein [Streptococcus pneumoniae]MBX4474531.1 hypothetical protein [Streptococcus pneumoniae]MBX4476585.1 hypothetical protein [Streptococcus pneumoniae]